MAIIGLPINHFLVTVKSVSGYILPGEVIVHTDISSEKKSYFVVCSFLLGTGVLELKSIGSFSGISHGFEIDSSFSSIKKSFLCKVASPGVLTHDGSVIQDVRFLTDINPGTFPNRHNLLTDSMPVRKWNTNFFSSSQFSYNSFDTSYLSVNQKVSLISSCTESYSSPFPCVLLSENVGLIMSADLKFYKKNKVIFISKDNRETCTVDIDLVTNISVHINNNKLKFKDINMTQDQINYLSNFSLCRFSRSVPSSVVSSFAQFVKNGKTFKKKDEDIHLLLINKQLEGSLIRSTVSNLLGGISSIKNNNRIDNTLLDGCFYGDYANEFLPQDDYSMIFTKDSNRTYCIGLMRFSDTLYNSGIIEVNGRFLSDGKNSLGNISDSLIDTGNSVTVSSIGFYFDNIFSQICNDILLSYSSKSLVSTKDIGTILYTKNGNTVDRSSPVRGSALFLHNSIVGESIPSMVNSRFTVDVKSENYVNGSSFLNRDVRMVLRNRSMSGDSSMSVGLGFNPVYAYNSGQSRSYFVPMHGKMNVLLPYDYSSQDSSLSYRFSLLKDIDISLNYNDPFSKKQTSHFKINGFSCTEENSLYSFSDGVFKYVRKDGTISNVVRHNDAMILFCLATNLMAFTANNMYSSSLSYNSSIVFGFDDYGNSMSVGLSFDLYNSNKKLMMTSSNGKHSYSKSEDRDLAIYEFNRMVSSIRSFSSNAGNFVYMDLVKIISDFSTSNPKSELKNLKSKTIDAASIVSQLQFFATQMGDPQVDIFTFSYKYGGRVNTHSFSDTVLAHFDIRYMPSNISNRNVAVLGRLVIDSSDMENVWMYANIFSGSINSPYNTTNMLHSNINVNLSIESIIRRWLSGIDEISSNVSGYIINCMDDLSIYNINEMSSRNSILVKSVIANSKKNNLPSFMCGVSFSPITDLLFRGVNISDVDTGYIVNSERIIKGIVKPSIDAGAIVVLQRSDIDKYIMNSFDQVDSLSSDSSNGSCFLENIFDPDNPKGRSLYKDYSVVSYFNGMSLNNKISFSKIDSLKGKQYFSSYSDFEEHAYPPGAEIIDADVSFDRFNLRRKIIQVAQNIISSQVESVSVYLNEYGTGEDNNAGYISERSAILPPSTRMTNNFFGHNKCHSCRVNVGMENDELHFVNNSFYSPYSSLASREVFSFKSLDNFSLKKIFYRKHSDPDVANTNYVENSNIIDWSRLKGIFSVSSSSFYTYDGFVVQKGEGFSSNVFDIVHRIPLSAS